MSSRIPTCKTQITKSIGKITDNVTQAKTYLDDKERVLTLADGKEMLKIAGRLKNSCENIEKYVQEWEETDDFEETAYKTYMNEQNVLDLLVEVSDIRSDLQVEAEYIPCSTNQTVSASNESINSHSLQVKLRPFDLPKFDGNPTKWPSFHDLFSAMVESQSISNVQKLCYLKNSLSGSALNVIEGFKITEANYKAAWELLEERFGREDDLKALLISQLDQLKPSTNTSDTRVLLDQLKVIFRQFKDSKISYESDLMTYRLKVLLPPWLLRQVFNEIKDPKERKTEKILEIADNIISTEETIQVFQSARFSLNSNSPIGKPNSNNQQSNWKQRNHEKPSHSNPNNIPLNNNKQVLIIEETDDFGEYSSEEIILMNSSIEISKEADLSKAEKATAILDTGSTVNIITTAFAKRLGLKLKPSTRKFFGFGAQQIVAEVFETSAYLKQVCDNPWPINLIVVDKIMQPTPVFSLSPKSLKDARKLQFKKLVHLKEPDLLIGSTTFNEIEVKCPGKSISNGLIFTPSNVGNWISGELKGIKIQAKEHAMLTIYEDNSYHNIGLIQALNDQKCRDNSAFTKGNPCQSIQSTESKKNQYFKKQRTRIFYNSNFCRKNQPDSKSKIYQNGKNDATAKNSIDNQSKAFSLSRAEGPTLRVNSEVKRKFVSRNQLKPSTTSSIPVQSISTESSYQQKGSPSTTQLSSLNRKTDELFSRNKVHFQTHKNTKYELKLKNRFNVLRSLDSDYDWLTTLQSAQQLKEFSESNLLQPATYHRHKHKQSEHVHH